MKLSKRNILITASIVALAGVGTTGAYYFDQPVPANPQVVASTDKEDAPTEEQADDEDAKAVSPIEEARPQTIPAAEPTVEVAQVAILPIQSYAEMYLNLGPVMTGQYGYTGQDCFDALVAAQPHRFTENVRERNIKALGILSTPCVSGYGVVKPGTYKSSVQVSIENETFYDSELAKSRW